LQQALHWYSKIGMIALLFLDTTIMAAHLKSSLFSTLALKGAAPPHFQRIAHWKKRLTITMMGAISKPFLLV
jgi:hypothetical protein